MITNDGVLVRVDQVEKVFHRGSEEIHVLTGLNLDVPRGEFLALMGPSGSGKSTLLNLIGGLDRATRGKVEVGGERIERMSDRALAAWRAKRAMKSWVCCKRSTASKARRSSWSRTIRTPRRVPRG